MKYTMSPGPDHGPVSITVIREKFFQIDIGTRVKAKKNIHYIKISIEKPAETDLGAPGRHGTHEVYGITIRQFALINFTAFAFVYF